MTEKRDKRRSLRILSLGVVLAGGLFGAALWIAGEARLAGFLWGMATGIVLVPLTAGIAADLRRGTVGVDIIALLAMGGALALGEYLAGLVVALMLSGGEVLEEYAGNRAARELTSLVNRAPRVAHRRDGASVRDVPIEAVEPGSLVMVKPGEVVPLDGMVESPVAVLDEAALTGEALPVERLAGEPVRSGVVNAGSPFELRATATAEESTYTGIVRLVQQAQLGKAPLVRLADRYAITFLPLTVAIATAAWLVSGDPRRALAVLVVATPCPLILAAPIAIVGGISRAARQGIIVKGGGILEALGRARVLLFDKTGTLTEGIPRLSETVVRGREDRELLRLAASIDLASPHVLAAALVKAAHAQGIDLTFPTDVKEEPGLGIEGTVGNHRVRVGKLSWLVTEAPGWARRVRRRATYEGVSTVFAAIDGELAGALVFEDRLRADGARTLRQLRRLGVERIAMVTGDHADVADRVGSAIGVDGVYADRSPAEKVDAVMVEKGIGGTTVMVGDGINDAPALAAADVGIAMGARGATASSEAADVVIVVDDLARAGEAIRISQRSRNIAVQSILFGMGLSAVGMGFAAAGLLAPVAGAVAQEAIDVAAILNALRALRDGPEPRRVANGESARFRAEHRELLPAIDQLRELSDRMDQLDPDVARSELHRVHAFLLDRLMPHEREEEGVLYPVIDKIMGGQDPTAAMTRTHVEITHFVKLLGRAIDDLDVDGPTSEDLPELRRVMYGLHAILRLHFAQEEEAYSVFTGAAEVGEDASP